MADHSTNEHPILAVLVNLGWILPLIGVEEIVAGRTKHGVWLVGLGIAVGTFVYIWPRVSTGLVNRLERRAKGRKGLLNLRIDVPKALVDQERSLLRLATLSGRLVDAIKDGATAAESAQSDNRRMSESNRIAVKVRPIAKRMLKEAAVFELHTSTLCAGLSRWLEIAERDDIAYGLADQVPALIEMMKSGDPVRPVLVQSRAVLEKLRGVNDSMDLALGQASAALDVVAKSMSETVECCESALRRIRVLLEKEVAKS